MGIINQINRTDSCTFASSHEQFHGQTGAMLINGDFLKRSFSTKYAWLDGTPLSKNENMVVFRSNIIVNDAE